MERILIILKLILLLPVLGAAQWQSRIGLNVVPLVAKSLEVTSEFSHHPVYSLNFNAGYTFNTGYLPLFDIKFYDGVEKRRTSGAFAKAGGRVYPGSLNGRERRANFFVGAGLIVSEYKQKALKADLSSGSLDLDYRPVSSKGVILCPSFSMGFTAKVAKKMYLDWGIQKAFVNREDDLIGKKYRNYQPGAGSGQVHSLTQYIQGILVLKYDL
jgi:hypothetical protein